jgi:hypothetical protein
MYDRTFQPAGAAMAAIVASLAPSAYAEPVQAEANARETLIAQAAKFKPAAPFGEDVAKGAQLALPFSE